AHCHENLERMELKSIPVMEEITFLIGPEGDFSEKEIAFLAEHKIKAVSLGNQRLRTETAGVFVAAWNYYNMI
ncbi:RsmE family RNA methyltransferase, partial [Chryseobacterium contaminans]